MSTISPPTLIDDDGEVRELTDADFVWAVSAHDFGNSVARVTEFLEQREVFLRQAEAVGIPREAFLPFDPSTPGFEDRAKALMSLPKAVGWAAK